MEQCRKHLEATAFNCIQNARSEYELGRANGMSAVYGWLVNYQSSIEHAIAQEVEEQEVE